MPHASNSDRRPVFSGQISYRIPQELWVDVERLAEANESSPGLLAKDAFISFIHDSDIRQQTEQEFRAELFRANQSLLDLSDASKELQRNLAAVLGALLQSMGVPAVEAVEIVRRTFAKR